MFLTGLLLCQVRIVTAGSGFQYVWIHGVLCCWIRFSMDFCHMMNGFYATMCRSEHSQEWSEAAGGGL